MGQLAHWAAAIQRRQWLADLAHRRLETAKMRTLASYIAATMQLEKGADNPMADQAPYLTLGAGTEYTGDGAPPATPAAAGPAPAAAAAGGDAGRPMAVVDPATLPDAPPSVKVGQRDPNAPAGPHNPATAIPFEQVGRLLGGGPV